MHLRREKPSLPSRYPSETFPLHKLIAVVLLSLAIFTVCYCGFVLRNTFWGDPTIYLIYARNIAGGDWFSFNPGEFSSGSTSPLWAAILSLSFIFSDGVMTAKIISFFFTALTLIIIYLSLLYVTKSEIGSAFGFLPFTPYFLPNALMMYETPLIVALVSSLIALNWEILFKKNYTKLSWLALIWALIPLSRPEMTLLVFLDFLVMIFINRGQKKAIIRTTLLFSLSLMPTILYYGFSYFATGSLSSSSFCRSYAIFERPFSLAGIIRYLVPFTPIGALALAFSTKWILTRFESWRQIMVIFIVIAVSIFALKKSFIFSLTQEAKGLTFEVITEKKVMDQINSIAPSGSTVLIYEVQDRFNLRQDIDVLSLDGIIDGKIGPYFDDVVTFLRYYRPTYWVANNAVYYRPYLSRGILKQITDIANKKNRQVTIENIRFTNVWVNPDYNLFPSFANASAIYKIDYLP